MITPLGFNEEHSKGVYNTTRGSYRMTIDLLSRLKAASETPEQIQAIMDSPGPVFNLKEEERKTPEQKELAEYVEYILQELTNESVDSNTGLALRNIKQIYEGKKDVTTKQSDKTGFLDYDGWYEKGRMVPGNGVSQYLEQWPHVLTEYSRLMHEFSGTHWLKDSEPLVIERLHGTDRRVRRSEIAEIIAALKSATMISDPDKFDLPLDRIMPLPEHTLPVQKGLLNLKTGELNLHSPDYYYTSLVPRNYMRGAIPEFFIEFLGVLFKGDPDRERKKAQIFETMAWTLMMNYDIHGCVVFYGQGGEGKSILHSIIVNLLDNASSLTLDEIETDKFKRAELYGMMANLVSESTSRVIGSEWFKRLTDGTIITADRKNGQPFKFISIAKWIIDTNELPVKEGELRAFYRRVIAIIDFPNLLEDLLSPVQISMYVKRLIEPDELDRVFSYVIDNFYTPLVERMKFTSQLKIAEAEKMWEERSNPAVSYIKMKDSSGLIETDTDKVREYIKNHNLDERNYIIVPKDKFDEPVTVTPKIPLVAEAVDWAIKKGFPAKNITVKQIGNALVACGYPNIQWDKRINGTLMRAWKDIFIAPSQETVSVDNHIPVITETASEDCDSGAHTSGVSITNANSQPTSVHSHVRGREGDLRQQRLIDPEAVNEETPEQSQLENTELRLTETVMESESISDSPADFEAYIRKIVSGMTERERIIFEIVKDAKQISAEKIHTYLHPDPQYRFSIDKVPTVLEVRDAIEKFVLELSIPGFGYNTGSRIATWRGD